VFVDDDKTFLKNFSLQFDDDLAYYLYSDPKKAIQHLNSNQRLSLDKRCFSTIKELMNNNRDERLLRLDINLFEQEVSDNTRFSDVSVVVVDYAMKEMDGLEFCKQITNPRVKKVLFTGVADEQIAVEAFNEGIIHRFLRKSEPDILEKLNRTIAELQRRYFAEISQMVQSSLELSEPVLFQDKAFGEYFHSLLEDRGIKEYYFVEDPAGFLLVSADGEISRLLLCTDEDIENQVNYCEMHDIHPKFVQQLKDRTHNAYFWQPIEDIADGDEADLEEFFPPSYKVEGSKTYYVSVVDNAPVDIEFNSGESNYEAYLEKLDQLQQDFSDVSNLS